MWNSCKKIWNTSICCQNWWEVYYWNIQWKFKDKNHWLKCSRIKYANKY